MILNQLINEKWKIKESFILALETKKMHQPNSVAATLNEFRKAFRTQYETFRRTCAIKHKPCCIIYGIIFQK
jgi:hypothetical protein